MTDSFDYVIAGYVHPLCCNPFIRELINLSGGTCGPVVAGRLSEDPNVSVLILEAGSESALVENVQMPGA